MDKDDADKREVARRHLLACTLKTNPRLGASLWRPCGFVVGFVVRICGLVTNSLVWSRILFIV
jgi:hypothetical protein